jgi:hypothetical protein
LLPLQIARRSKLSIFKTIKRKGQSSLSKDATPRRKAMKPKAHAYYSYIGGGLLAAAILAIAGWGPLAIADKSQNPVFAVDPFWPKPLPAPVGTGQPQPHTDWG